MRPASRSQPHAVGQVSPPVRAGLVVLLLYVFLVGVSLLETGIGAMGEGVQDRLLASVANPIAGLCAGILVTVLVQSSSVSTSTIVGLVGAGTLSVELAAPMIMGANIGTTVTNTLASLGSIRRTEEFRRGFAAATVHDFFNLLAVVVLLPLELATGFLSRSADWLSGLLRGNTVAAPGRSPIKDAVDVPVDAVASVIEWATTITVARGLAFLGIGLVLIFVALGLITRNMRQLVAGRIEQAINRIIGRGGGAVAILIGLVVTVAVQSSSITTSILVPLAAGGVLTLQSVYPITLGANVGTTVTALIASLAVARPEGLTIALVHTLFNVSAMILLYPVPALRAVPIRAATALADLAVRRRSAVMAYVLGVFLVVPLVGIAALS